MAEKMQGREVIFEFRPVGNIMRVTAVDVATATEVVLQCPLSAGELAFKNNALSRLEYVLKRKNIIA